MLVMPHGFTSPAAATTASTIRGSTYASAGPAQELANVNVMRCLTLMDAAIRNAL